MTRSGYYLSTVNALSVGDDIENYEFDILSAYPNPFNPSVSIYYTMDVSDIVDISIVNLEGKVIDVIESSFKNKGTHSVVWSPHNLSSGVYFANISVANKTQTQKLMLLK